MSGSGAGSRDKMHGRLSRWRKWTACDVGEAKEGLENRQSSFFNLSVTSTTLQPILQPFFRFSYVTGSSRTSPGEPPMMRCHETSIFEICKLQRCRPTTPETPSQGRMKWNETKWMRWVWRNGGMKFVERENGRNPEINLTRLRFDHHETHMEWPKCELGIPAVGGQTASNSLRHEAT